MAWLRSSPRLAPATQHIGALSSLKRRLRHLSIDVRGDADITGSNQYSNGSGLGIPELLVDLF